MRSQPNPISRTAPGTDLNLWLARMAMLLGMVACLLGSPESAQAQLAAKTAEDWIKTLDSSNRVERLKIDETIAELKINPGSVIADIGAGSGLFSFPLARATGSAGIVYAVDIEPGLLKHIGVRAQELHLPNVQTVLGQFADPALPATNVDLAFINDVLHHIEDRSAYLKHLARYLKPSGRIVVIDFYPEFGPHKSEPALQVTQDQTTGWMSTIGFRHVEQINLFKDKWFAVYSR